MVLSNWRYRVYSLTVIFGLTVIVCDPLLAKSLKPHDKVSQSPTVRNVAIDSVDMEWWDDSKTLLFIDVTFNFPVSITTDIADKAQKTHILQLISTGSVAKSFRHSYSGSEHHAISKKFRDIVEEIRYEGGRGGKAQLLVYLHEPAILSYQMYKDFRTLHLEISRIQKDIPAQKSVP